MEKSNHILMRTVTVHGKKSIETWTPEKVFRCPDKKELDAKLKHYSKLLMSIHTPDSIPARRKYVELIRPALRYYCKRFGSKVPSWLSDDSHYTDMPIEERTKQFGDKPLRIHEFRNMRARHAKKSDKGKPDAK